MVARPGAAGSAGLSLRNLSRLEAVFFRLRFVRAPALLLNMDPNMPEPASSAAFALGLKASIGMAGAVALYMVMPPGRPHDRPTTRRELAREIGLRMAFAGLTSAAAGDWLIDILQSNAAWLLAEKHPTPFLMAGGALGWYAGRWVALALYRRQDKDIVEVVHEVRREVAGGDGT